MTRALVVVEASRARRWFWALVVLAVLSTGAAFRALNGADGGFVAVAFLLTALVGVTSTLQAARLLAAFKSHQPELSAGGRPSSSRAGPPQAARSESSLRNRLRCSGE